MMEEEMEEEEDMIVSDKSKVRLRHRKLV